MTLRFPELPALPLERYTRLLSAERLQPLMARVEYLRAGLVGRVVWNVSSTAAGGGVAEMVRSILSYARGAGVDARWVVIEAPPEFFRITKRLHNALHGSVGDGSDLGDAERRLFEHVGATNVAELAPLVRAGDVVIVHDPQPAGMIAALLERGARVIWRCHIGADEVDDEVQRGWRFLAPYVQGAHAYVFSRAAYIPAQYIDPARAKLIAPTIDPFSAKNQPLDERSVLAILARARLVESDVDAAVGTFLREDGTPSRVDNSADVVREGAPPPASTPLVVQVSRWDELKDPAGVLEGFTRLDPARIRGAHLVLAGPNTTGVADDPEGAAVLAAVTARWRGLPVDVRRRIHLASLPTFEIEENAAIVNALQRHATVIVQKSLHEGFGLTVTEAMWKARPVVASAVGGIQDQLDDGVEGLLLDDASDLDAFAAAIARLFDDPDAARQMGIRGHARVLDHSLALNSLLSYGALIEWIDGRDTLGA
ncbi:MAG: glycosyltransferase [Kofleriaceae bacterium]|nr:MAG: glycosyltransferase [Kofleriaceae bacterium]MBZ0238299.1 glycosyltransferase [Kofleriaceae bacterium]